MVGLELEIGGKKVAVAVERGVASIIVQSVKTEWEDAIDLTFTGLLQSKEGEDHYVDWYKTDLKAGDEMIIRVKEISTNSEPIQSRARKAEVKTNLMLKQFLALRKQLQEEGIPIPEDD